MTVGYMSVWAPSYIGIENFAKVQLKVKIIIITYVSNC